MAEHTIRGNGLRTIKKHAMVANHALSSPDPFFEDEGDDEGDEELDEEVDEELDVPLVELLPPLLPELEDELSPDFAPSPLLPGLAAAGGVVDSPSPPRFRFLSPDLKSVSYQPPPFSRKADIETCLRKVSCLQAGQFFSGSSLNF